jgi:hypothetical protein
MRNQCILMQWDARAQSMYLKAVGMRSLPGFINELANFFSRKREGIKKGMGH